MSNARNVDKYLQQTVRLGNEGSELLTKLTAPTLGNSGYVDVIEQGMNGLAVIRPGSLEYRYFVHTMAGDPKITNIDGYVDSVVDRLVAAARAHGMSPIGFANVIDASTGDPRVIRRIANRMVKKANEYNVAIMNGELAILGERVNAPANINATMVSIGTGKGTSITDGNRLDSVKAHLEFDGAVVEFAGFDPKGMPVYLNSDGVGTKTEMYERSKEYGRALIDSNAMRLDDLVKKGATARVSSDIVEVSGRSEHRTELSSKVYKAAEMLSRALGIMCTAQIEDAGNRLAGYGLDAGLFTYNVSGSSVSTIDEEMLKHPLMPNPGDNIIAIAPPVVNARSNGYRARREIMEAWLGIDWHLTKTGEMFMEYLSQPSVIFYPLFRRLIDKGMVTSIYHMSGGAFNGKLAKPLAARGLYAELKYIFGPDPRDLAMIGASGMSLRDAYAKWTMGNDAFVTTLPFRKQAAMDMIKEMGLVPRVAGTIVRKSRQSGTRRKILKGISLKGPDGKQIDFDGK